MPLPSRETPWSTSLHNDDSLIASLLFRAGIPLANIAATFQLPPTSVAKSIYCAHPPSAPDVSLMRMYRGFCGCVTFATDSDSAWTRLFSDHADDVPPGYDARTQFTVEHLPAFDSHWNMRESLTDSLRFSIGYSVHCPCCGAQVKSLSSNPLSPIRIGTIGSPIAPPPNLVIDKRIRRIVHAGASPSPSYWGMDHIVCSACWIDYEPLLPGLARLRRRRILNYLEDHYPRALATLA